MVLKELISFRFYFGKVGGPERTDFDTFLFGECGGLGRTDFR